MTSRRPPPSAGSDIIHLLTRCGIDADAARLAVCEQLGSVAEADLRAAAEALLIMSQATGVDGKALVGGVQCALQDRLHRGDAEGGAIAPPVPLDGAEPEV